MASAGQIMGGNNQLGTGAGSAQGSRDVAAQLAAQLAQMLKQGLPGVFLKLISHIVRAYHFLPHRMFDSSIFMSDPQDRPQHCVAVN